MAERIEPDLNFVKNIISSGGGSLKKCFQCATCSVVCKLSPDDKPFPRKEMIYAQWGLKNRLMGDPDIWLCHQCSDCTAYCPRGAKPGEVIGAIRNQFIQNYSAFGFLGKMASSPSYLIILLVIPVLILLGVLFHLGNLDFTAIPRGEEGVIVFYYFMPHIYVIVIYVALVMFAFLSFVVGVVRYWKELLKNRKEAESPPSGSIVGSIVGAVKEILVHKRFKKCGVERGRKISHLLTFYGFIGLAIGTAWATVKKYGFGIMPPFPLTDPMQWLTNASSAALFVGLGMIIFNRLKDKSKAGIGSYFDWFFIVILAVTGVTGMAAQVFRLADMGVSAYTSYFLHLVFIFYLFAYAPFSKFAHMIYRTAAMVFESYTLRKIPLAAQADK